MKSQEGNTTRIADSLIQLLFKTGRCLVKDHKDGDDDKLLQRLILRLSFEHPHVKTYVKTTKSGLKMILLSEPHTRSEGKD